MSSKNAKTRHCEELTSIIDEKIIIEFIRQEHTNLMMKEMDADGTFVAPGTDELCFDHNRVILKEDKESSDKINASYIAGFKQPKAYIVTKTPDAEAAIHKFWKMVWEQQSEVIVMLNKPDQNEKGLIYWKLEERSTLYCEKLSVETIKVWYLHQSFEITTLLVTHEDGGSLLVDHFLYKNWSKVDSVPSGADFINLVMKTRLKNKYAPAQKLPNDYKTPVVVHCSDGLNRSIVFCAIDISITRDQKIGDVNIFSIMSQLRKQRYDCLHYVDHYVFCYSAFCEYLNFFT
ncbi:GSCOCT00014311001.2-RA-CDS [Cotesia congregata]|uniref:Cc_ptp.l_1.7 n=2 Tax=root TaxID=1 RepID=S6CWN5_COTCN|nr:PTPL [Bracoviriform congregatae]CAD6244247.1 GSCOCT00014311001.2-RA-CDS [Cotesia congregata]CAG17385.1 PTPL [Bracoviriform congregatae]CAG26731.1 protein tyrosine phosphatase [Bracoviriform congregatae]CAG5093992.1 cc_ptp.l_1.7 [Cotesia congregata]CCQ71320.1 protein tyrosine phosphatase PTPL [Cotesia congregata]